MSRIMGILNVTHDSFYDAGCFHTLDHATRRMQQIKEEGADYIDIGGESSRPGSPGVSLEVEFDRVVPVLRASCDFFPKDCISVDTRKSGIAIEAFKMGITTLNDISALQFDPNMLPVCVEYGASVILVHMQNHPENMQDDPQYDDVVEEIMSFFESRITVLCQSGVKQKNILLDPGIGFGKKLEHNFEIIKNISKFRKLGYRIVLGHSRKSFISDLSKKKSAVFLQPLDRLEGSLTVSIWASLNDVDIVRVHDVESTYKALQVIEAIRS